MRRPAAVRRATEAFTRLLRVEGWSDDAESASELERLVRVGVGVAIALAVAQAVLHLLNVYVLDGGIAMFNADADESIAGWTGTAASAAVVLPVALLALRNRSIPLLVLAAGVAFLSFDDMLAIHERIHTADGSIGPIERAGRLAWTTAYAPLILVLFAGLWACVTDAPPSVRRAVRAGGLALGLAVAMEVASTGLIEAGFDHGAVLYEMEVAVEEGLESAGWLVIAWGLTTSLLVQRSVAPERDRTAQERRLDG